MMLYRSTKFYIIHLNLLKICCNILNGTHLPFDFERNNVFMASNKIGTVPLFFLTMAVIIVIFSVIFLVFFTSKDKNKESSSSSTSSDTSKISSQTSSEASSSSSSKSSSKASSTSKTSSTSSKSSSSAVSTSTEKPFYVDGVLVVNKKYAVPKNYFKAVNPDARTAFYKMQADAKTQSITLKVFSGFRTYEFQQTLYNNYVKADGKAAADTYSARPGHSEHETGLAFDISGADDSYQIKTEFGITTEGKWLAANSSKYGFIIRYPKGKEAVTGYQYEPWHLRYVGVTLADKIYKSGKCLEEYLNLV